MRDVPAGFGAAVKTGTVHVCELYEFTLRNGSTYYYCTHDEDMDWGTPTIRYYSAPIQRSVIGSSMNLEIDTTEVRISGITAELFDEANKNSLDNLSMTTKRALWDQGSGSGMEFVIFVGTGNISFDRNELVVPFSSILGSLNIVIPKNVFHNPCNYTMFDTGCTLVRADYKASSTTTSAATNSYSLIDATFTVPGGDPYKYNNGEVEITSGLNLGERRNILTSENGLITVCVPFPNVVAAGVTYDYYPGCDYSPETCRDRFSNEVNFYGFPYLPGPEESM